MRPLWFRCGSCNDGCWTHRLFDRRPPVHHRPLQGIHYDQRVCRSLRQHPPYLPLHLAPLELYVSVTQHPPGSIQDPGVSPIPLLVRIDVQRELI
jgi:hypothetical protein